VEALGNISGLGEAVPVKLFETRDQDFF
jgi:hypothetical protein